MCINGRHGRLKCINITDHSWNFLLFLITWIYISILTYIIWNSINVFSWFVCSTFNLKTIVARVIKFLWRVIDVNTQTYWIQGIGSQFLFFFNYMSFLGKIGAFRLLIELELFSCNVQLCMSNTSLQNCKFGQKYQMSINDSLKSCESTQILWK